MADYSTVQSRGALGWVIAGLVVLGLLAILAVSSAFDGAGTVPVGPDGVPVVEPEPAPAQPVAPAVAD